MKKVFLLMILPAMAIIALSSCISQPQTTGPTPQAAVSPTQTLPPTPTASETPINIPGVQPITVENISRLDLLYNLGEGKILNTAISPDQQYIAVLSVSGIHLYDRITYKEIYTHRLEMSIYLNDIQFSRDGKSIYFSNINKLYRWNYESDDLQEVFASQIANPIIRKISLSPKEDRIIITSVIFNNECENEAHNTALYDMDGNLLYDVNTCDSESDYFYKYIGDQLALFAVNSHYLQVRADEMALVNITTGKIIASSMQWLNNEGFIKTRSTGNTAFIPDFLEFNNWIENNFPRQESNLELQKCTAKNIFSYTPKNVLYEDEQGVDLIISNSANTKIVKMDPITCEIIQEIHYPASKSYMFSPDSSLLATSDQLSTYIWELGSGELKFEPAFDQNESIAYSFNSDGSKFTMLSRTYDANADDSIYELKILDSVSTEEIYCIAIPMGYPTRIVKTNNPDLMILQDNKYSYIYNIKHGKLIRKITGTKLLLDPRLDAVWIPVQKWGNTQVLTLFYLETGMKITELPEINGEIQDLSFRPNSAVITVHNFHLNNVSELQLDLLSNTLPWITVSDDFQGRTLDENRHSSGWSLSMNPPIPNNHANIIENFSLDMHDTTSYLANSLLLIHDRNSIDIWDIQSPAYLAHMEFQTQIEDAVFSPGGNYIAVFCSNGVVKILGVKE